MQIDAERRGGTGHGSLLWRLRGNGSRPLRQAPRLQLCRGGGRKSRKTAVQPDDFIANTGPFPQQFIDNLHIFHLFGYIISVPKQKGEINYGILRK